MPDWAKFCTECGAPLKSNEPKQIGEPRIIVHCDGPAELFYNNGSIVDFFDSDKVFPLSKQFFDGQMRFMDSPSKRHTQKFFTRLAQIVEDAKTKTPSEAAADKGIRSVVFADCAGFVSKGPIRFSDCHKLENFDLGQLDTSRWESLADMFRACYVLKELNLSSMITLNVSSVRRIFKDCVELRYLDLSAWNLDNCDESTDMFTNCQSLSKVVVRGCTPFTVALIDRELKRAGIREQVELIH